MGLSETTVQTLKVCEPILKQHQQELGETFYRMLFDNHPDVKSQFNLSNAKAQQISLTNSVVAFCANCDNLSALTPTVVRVAEKHVSVNVTAEQYTVVGLTLLAAMEEVLGKEIFNESVKAAVTEGYFFLADIFIKREASMVKEREISEGGWTGWRKFQLKKKAQETSLHTSFYFTPEDGGPLMQYKAGQYITMRIRHPDFDHDLIRHYSLSFYDDCTCHQYRITVKKESDGVVSSYLHNDLQEGDTVEFTAPSGDFFLGPLVPRFPSPQVFIGAGTGLTPLLAMLHLAATRPTTQSLLLYKAHHPLSHPLSEELLSLVSQSPHLSAVLFYSTEGPTTPSTPRVRVLPAGTNWDASTLGPYIKDLESKFYMCGPPAFTKDTLNILKELGVQEDRISYEFFGPQT